LSAAARAPSGGFAARGGSPRRLALVLVIALVAWAARVLEDRAARTAPPPASAAQVLEAFRAHRSQVMAEGEGRVSRLLEDDREGSRHQRFLVALEGGHTLLVAHNIDLAERVPVKLGDAVAFRGQYEWNEKGGVLHWTHRDPGGRRPGGWIRHEGRMYR